MKILVICQYYYPEPFRISDICEALVECGHEVMVVTGTPNYPEGNIYAGYEGTDHRDEIRNGVRIHRCPIHPRKKGAVHRLWNYYSYVFSSKSYLSRMDEEFDVVLVYQLSPVMMAEGAIHWARKHDKKCVLYCLDLWPESLLVSGIKQNSLIYRIFYHISVKIYGKMDRILLASNGFLQYFTDYLHIATSKLAWLPQHAEDLYADVKPKLTHEPPYHFMFAGNVGDLQSVETLIEAAQLLKHDSRIRFHIVGDGISLNACKNMAKDLENVIFYGRCPVEDMPSYYEMADVMVVTLKKIKSMEGTLPGKVQSYMLAGKPIVGACDGETAYVIQDAACGLCAPAEDPITLAKHIQTMVEHDQWLIQYSENAREYSRKRYTKDGFVENLIQHLTEVQ